MQYFNLKFDEESQELWVVITPFGKYKYKRHPMGLKCATNFEQQAMKMYYEESTILKYTLMTLDASPMNHDTILNCWTKW